MNSRQRLATDHTDPNWTEPELNWTEQKRPKLTEGVAQCDRRVFIRLKIIYIFVKYPCQRDNYHRHDCRLKRERDLAESTACWGIKKAACV